MDVPILLVGGGAVGSVELLFGNRTEFDAIESERLFYAILGSFIHHFLWSGGHERGESG
jgi:hypothetical protein